MRIGVSFVLDSVSYGSFAACLRRDAHHIMSFVGIVMVGF